MKFKFVMAAGLFALIAGCSPKYTKPELATHFNDPFMGLSDLDEKPVAHKHNKEVTVIEFFASWCEACQKEAPEIGKLASKYQKKGAQFYGVSVDFDPSESKEFVKQHGIKYPVLWDHTQEAQIKFDIEEVPATVVLDKAGKLVYRTQGHEQKPVATLDRHLAKLVGPKASQAKQKLQ